MRRALLSFAAITVGFFALLVWSRDPGPPSSRPITASSAAPSAGALSVAPAHVENTHVEESSPSPAQDLDRVDVSLPADHWQKVAKDYVAKTSVRGDAFHEVLLQMLKGAADHDVEPVRLGAGSITMGDASEAEKNSMLNPLAVRLSDGDRERLNQMLLEFNASMRAAERDLNLTHKLCTSKCLLRGDYRSYPAGTENINARIVADSQSEFDNPSDMNHICLPAPDGTIRAVVLKPASSPEYFGVLQNKRRLEAEHAIALRMFFYPARR